jgi:hypothetical protein
MSRPLIFTGIQISTSTTDPTTASTFDTFDLIDDENITITNELEESLVEGGQTIVNGFNQGIEAITYDLDVLTSTTNSVNTVIQTDSDLKAKGSIRLIGAVGSVDVDILNVRISAVRPFQDLRRDHVLIKATLTSKSGISVTDADAG